MRVPEYDNTAAGGAFPDAASFELSIA